MDVYLEELGTIIELCSAKLENRGSMCWQVGHHVRRGEVFPLDALLYPYFKAAGLHLRNRIVWQFGHGLHASRRFSGRHETILWFTKSDGYIFNLDAVRVPAKYPGKKAYKGSNAGAYSGNPLGKNPTDVWDIPNVKHRHPEKTIHPCQFPVELVERLVLALTEAGGLVVDPFIGVGTTACAAVLHGRRCAGAEVVGEYVELARRRIQAAAAGKLRVRERGKPILQPPDNWAIARRDG